MASDMLDEYVGKAERLEDENAALKADNARFETENLRFEAANGRFFDENQRLLHDGQVNDITAIRNAVVKARGTTTETKRGKA